MDLTVRIHCIIVTPIWRPEQQPSATTLFPWRGGVTSRKWRCIRGLLLAWTEGGKWHEGKCYERNCKVGMKGGGGIRLLKEKIAYNSNLKVISMERHDRMYPCLMDADWLHLTPANLLWHRQRNPSEVLGSADHVIFRPQVLHCILLRSRPMSFKNSVAIDCRHLTPSDVRMKASVRSRSSAVVLRTTWIRCSTISLPEEGKR